MSDQILSTALVGLAAGYMIIAWCSSYLFSGVRDWLNDRVLAYKLENWLGALGGKVGRHLTYLLHAHFVSRPMCAQPFIY